MAEVVVSKTVFFIGAWRTQEVTENLLKQIASSLTLKKGFSTTLTLSSGGLELLIHDKAGHVTRTDKIPLQDIIDFIGSKYSKTCIHAVVKDRKNYFTVFVFLCSSERDAGEMVQTFTMIKKRLSGEGYNLHLTPKGTNWIIQSKVDSETGNVERVSGVTVENRESVIINDNSRGNRIHEVRVLSNGDARPVVDNISHHTNDSELKDELIHLSDEVKAIKLMLEKQQQPQTTYSVQQQGYRIVTDAPQNTYHIKQEVVTEPKSMYKIQHQGYKVVQEPKSTYQISQNDYKVVQEPENAVHIQRHVVQQPLYENTGGGGKVVYHLETMAEQPTIKTQTIYTKNQRYGSKKEYSNGAGGYYVMRGRTNTGHSKAGSNVSLAHSTNSYYTRRRYDSPNPMADKQLSTKQVKNSNSASMKYLTSTKGIKGVQGQHALLYKTYSSDKVLKNIEDVYKNRISVKRHAVPVVVNRHSAEYVNTAQISPSGSRQTSMKFVAAPAPEVGHVKPLQRKFIHETAELKEEGWSKSDASVLHARQTTDVDPGYVNTIVQENIIVEPEMNDERVYTVESSEKRYGDGLDSERGAEIEENDDVIVIKAETISESEQPGFSVVENTEEHHSYVLTQNPEVSRNDVTYVSQENNNPEENVIHIKAETAGQTRYVRDYREVEVIDTRTDEEKTDAEQQNGESNSARNSAHVIIREEHIRPPSDFQDARDSLELAGGTHEEVRRVTKNGKKVHYMEELQQNIGERRNSDIEFDFGLEENDKDMTVENNNNDDEEDNEVKYILDTEKLKAFTAEPDIVIVENKDSYRQTVISENDLQRGEDTVLF